MIKFIFIALLLTPLKANAVSLDLENDCHKVSEGYTICETEDAICEIIDEERIFCNNK